MFLPIVELVFLVMTRFHSVVYDDAVYTSLENMNTLVRLWREKLLAGTLYESSLQDVENDFGIRCVEDRIKKIRAVLSNARGHMDLAKCLKDKQKEKSSKVHSPANSQCLSMVKIIPPGTFNGVDQTPRHDNDRFNIRNIRIVPTMDEVLSPHAHALPGNHIFEPNLHWLPSGPERHLDTQFRLMREDMVSSIRRAMRFILRELSTGDGNLTGGKTKVTAKSEVLSKQEKMDVDLSTAAYILLN
jgi:hypothetical protein